MKRQGFLLWLHALTSRVVTHLLSNEYKNLKWPEHEADQSPASSSEFKNVVVIFSKIDLILKF